MSKKSVLKVPETEAPAKPAGDLIPLKPYRQPEMGRYEALELQIEAHFGQVEDDELDDVAQYYEASLLELLQVARVKTRGVTLNHFFHDETFQPVDFPEPIRALLKPGDLFMIMVGYRRDRWHVLWMSPMYH